MWAGSLIREARAGEAETLAAIQRAASLEALGHIFSPELYPLPVDAVRARRAEWLDGLYVRPEHWKHGLGRKLHDEVLGRLRAGGSLRCHLWVLEDNDRARRFYERLRWRENGDTRIVPFSPNPIDVGYTIELETTLATL